MEVIAIAQLLTQALVAVEKLVSAAHDAGTVTDAAWEAHKAAQVAAFGQDYWKPAPDPTL